LQLKISFLLALQHCLQRHLLLILSLLVVVEVVVVGVVTVAVEVLVDTELLRYRYLPEQVTR